MVTRLPRSTDTVPVLSWPEFESAFVWNQGENVTLIGPIKSGKTTLAQHLFSRRRTGIVIATKPRDETIERFRTLGYKVWRELPLPPAEMYPRIVFWPKIRKVSDRPKQKAAIIKLLVEVYQQGGDALYLDETAEICDDYKLEPLVKLILRQGRTSHISMMNGTQRPVDIPLLCYSMARHLFFWKTADQVDIKRVSGFAGADRLLVAREVSRLEPHQFLYLNTWDGTLAISRVDLDPAA